MGKIALLVPREEMLYQAHNILQEKKYAVGDMRVIQTENAVMEARDAIGKGASIIIARGLQASMIKQYTDVPVVEIVATAQEMALLVVRARQILKKERPFIAAVGFKNMFCDMRYFDSIYNIKLRTYFAGRPSELRETALKAIEDGAELLIGGDVAVEAAKEADLPSLFLSSTEDSMRVAFSMAESMDFAMGAQKRSSAQLEALLDYSFNGVVNIDREGRITAANPVMKDILGHGGEEAVGKLLPDVFSDIDHEKFGQVLRGEAESYASFMDANGTSVFAVLAPVRVGNETEGAILTCHKVRRQREEQPVQEKPSKYPGLTATGRLSMIAQRSKPMQNCIRLARLYAQAREPVLILGEEGTERRILAEGIHNLGPAAGGAFFAVMCGGLSGQQQEDALLGDNGAFFAADGGTLYLEDVEALSPLCQGEICRLIRYRRGGRDYQNPRPLRIRVMASSQKNLEELGKLAGQGILKAELYYLLAGLVLEIPPLRSRPEDLDDLIRQRIKEAFDQYGRYHKLTAGAQRLLREYAWPGNLLQLSAFLNRMVLTADRHSIDELQIGRLLAELYPPGLSAAEPPREKQEARELTESREAREILRILAEEGGSRERTAQRLGISKATLWRRMKKFHIQ